MDVDILVVGAGLSGIDVACRLQERCPGLEYAIVEARASLGGTWDLFRYPGVRSDSDMATYSLPFRPWRRAESIAAGADILGYLREVATEYRVTDRVRWGQRAVAAAWDSRTGRWHVRTSGKGGGVMHRARFLYLATGYYRYDRGHVVDFPGQGSFTGDVVHPQAWPEGLDVAGKRVVVVGSGATAVTLVPALARLGAHVTMLQRSPGYLLSLPSADPLGDRLRRVLPDKAAYRIVRARNIAVANAGYLLMRRFPRAARALLQRGVAAALPEGYDVGTHFTPRYDPWDERLCVVPDADFFEAVRSGRAEVVTDTVGSFTASGVRLGSGGELPADVVVTATGLSLLPAGGIRFTVDGQEVDLAACRVHRGMMLSDVPNAVWCVGYPNASWTLRADLTARTFCRLLRHLERHGWTVVTPRYDAARAGKPAQPARLPREHPARARYIPRLREQPAHAEGAPLLALSSGYIRRAEHLLPRQGASPPWRVRQSYLWDVLTMRLRPFDDGSLEFTGPGSEGP